MSQLGYIIGKKNLFKTLQEYFNEWKFKHPNPNDFRRVAERVSRIKRENSDTIFKFSLKNFHSTFDYEKGILDDELNKIYKSVLSDFTKAI